MSALVPVSLFIDAVASALISYDSVLASICSQVISLMSALIARVRSLLSLCSNHGVLIALLRRAIMVLAAQVHIIWVMVLPTHEGWRRNYFSCSECFVMFD